MIMMNCSSIFTMNKKKESTTDRLEEILEQSGADKLTEYLTQEKVYSADREDLFGEYVKSVIREKGFKQKDVFLRAGIDEKSGYKYLSGEKHTSNRDLIIRICLAAHMTLKESERALKLYGLSPLYARLERDAVFIIAFNRRIYDIDEVNEILESHGLEALYEPKMQDGN